MNTTNRIIGLTTASLVLAAAASAQSFTVGTFADPAANGSTPMFTITDTGNPLNSIMSGGWSGTGLNLQTPGFIGGGSIANAKFTMSNLNISSTGVATAVGGGPAVIQFMNASNQNVFKVTFDSATFNPFALGASTLFGNNVTFSGTNVPTGLSAQRFAFSFANETAHTGSTTYTSSFTSSAVPEPASMAALGIGIAAIIRRKRTR